MLFLYGRVQRVSDPVGEGFRRCATFPCGPLSRRGPECDRLGSESSEPPLSSRPFARTAGGCHVCHIV